MLTTVVAIIGLMSTATQGARLQAAAPVERPARLDSRIGAVKGPVPCDATLWQNPLIDLEGDVLLLRTRSSAEPRRLTIDELGSALTALPLSDWPYGRIVATPAAANPHAGGTSGAPLKAIPGVVIRAGIDSIWFWPSQRADFCARP